MRFLWICLLTLSLAVGLGAQPVSARNKFKIGRGYFQRGNYQAALDPLEQAIKEDSGYLDAHYLLGLTYLGMENYAKAEEKLAYVIGLDPSFQEAYQYLGQALVAQKKYDQARKHFQRMQTIPGMAVSAQYCLGVLAYQEGNLAVAEKCWQEAARLDPKDPRSRNNLGILRSGEGKHGDALVQFQVASKLAPERPRYRINEAWEMVALNRPDNARQILNVVLKTPELEHDLGFLTMAMLASLDGKWEQVVNHCNSCIERNKECTQAYLLKARAQEQLKKPEEASKSYQEALNSDGNLVEAKDALRRLTPPAAPK